MYARGGCQWNGPACQAPLYSPPRSALITALQKHNAPSTKAVHTAYNLSAASTDLRGHELQRISVDVVEIIPFETAATHHIVPTWAGGSAPEVRQGALGGRRARLDVVTSGSRWFRAGLPRPSNSGEGVYQGFRELLHPGISEFLSRDGTVVNGPSNVLSIARSIAPWLIRITPGHQLDAQMSLA
jgi:hypothetical protein